MRTLASLALLGILFAGCAEQTTPEGGSVAWEYDPDAGAEAPQEAPQEVAPDAPVESAEPSAGPGETVRFLIIGDQGAGNDAQFAVGETMKNVCAAQGCDFVMTTGDNIYDFGAFTADDPQFEEKFEQPYAGMVNDAGEEMPFYMSLGNHDNFFGGFAQLVGEAQVDYHHKHDRPSDMWNMPDRYYTQKFGNVLEIFAIDTDSIYKDDPMVPEVTPEIHQQWLIESLEASDAKWKIAFGHYNYVSNGNYGDGNAGFKAALEASLCDRATFYAFGHDHDLQWLAPQDSCGRTEFIGSSAAAKARAVDQDFEFDAYFGMGDVYGFAWVEIVDDRMTLQFVDVDQNVLFERTTTLSEMGW